MRENEIQDVLAEALAAGGMARGTSALSRNIAVRARAASKRAEDAAQGAQEGAEAARDEARAAREQAEREAAEARRLADDAQRSAASAGANAMEAQEAARQAQAGAVAANSSATQAAKDAAEAREKADAADAKAAEAAENSAGAAEEAAQAKADAAKAAQDVSGLAQSLSSVSSQVGDMVDVQARMQADIQTTAAGLASHASSITSIQAAAGEAQEKARAAQDAAEAASGDASQALAMVGQASGAAASAQQAADKAKEDAAQAQAAADRAQADLSDAQDALAAVEAKAGANAADIARAQQAVASAKASADAAQAVADAAKSSAATAQASADGAKADAAAAQKSADAAQASADAAQASADLLATRVTKCETAIAQDAEAIALMATKEELTRRLNGYYTKSEADASLKVQADRIDLAVGRIDSVSSIRQVARNGSGTMAQLRNYAAEGHRDTWTTWKSYAGVSPGDTVQLKCDCSDTGKPVYILMTVESVTPTSATCVSHGMVDPNAELAARAYTDAKVKVESDRITAEVAERGKLGTKVATLEQTASGLQSQVTSVKGTADAAKARLDNLRVGGRNLLRNSGRTVSTNGYHMATYAPSEPLVAGRTYTASLCVTPGADVAGFRPYVSGGYQHLCILTPSGTARQVLTATFTASYYPGRAPSDNASYADVLLYAFPNGHTSQSTVHWIKVEEGNTPTDWTPAPEDLASAATVAEHSSKITQLDSRISSEVSERTALGTKVSTLEQTADGLTARVNSIRVGGRNLVLGSGQERTMPQSPGWYTYDLAGAPVAVSAGEELSVSFDVRTSNGTDSFYASVCETAGNTAQVVATGVRPGTSWSRMSFVFKASRAMGVRQLMLCPGKQYSGHDPSIASNSGTLYARNVKLERGNQATDWTPAPEDVSSFRAFTTNYSYNQAQVDQYGTPGYQGTWAVNESTAGLRAGDTVQLRVTNTSKSGHAFVVGTVVSVPSDKSVVARTTGLVDTGDRGATGATGAQGPKGTSGTDLSQGKAMYADPFFSSGTNGCSVYDNTGSGNVTVARQARSADNPCAQSGHELKVTTKGAASPSHGGIIQNITSRAGAVFVRRVIAKIPAGYSLMNAENAMGSGYSCEWLTDRAGTGAFREYLYRYRCGSSGTFSSGGHMYLTGGAVATASAPVVWHLACCQTYDMTGAPDASEALAAASAAAQTVVELSTSVRQTNDSLTDSIARKTAEVSALQGQLAGLEGGLGSLSGRVGEVEASFRRTMDASGNPVLDLMTTANGFSTRITNQRMSFMDGGQEVAYVGNKKFYVDQMEVEGQMQVGDYAFVQRPGHLSLKYVGA